ncbi:MAG: peptidoglycan-binding protein LysM [Chitinophagales bacterium]|jgi:nucleoid-associated protein YgaU|nr:peptidoglycan-binding protein LysM [Chitinophagales bacterium]
MGLFSFIKDAGDKIFGNASSSEEQAKAAESHIKQYNISDKVTATVEGDTITLSGEVDDLLAKQKVLTIAGNIAGISKVVDNISVAQGGELAESNFYDVKPGDTLSKISKEVYGDPNRYNAIFEANKPMLSHPDKIYPGQKLVIPQA